MDFIKLKKKYPIGKTFSWIAPHLWGKYSAGSTIKGKVIGHDHCGKPSKFYAYIESDVGKMHFGESELSRVRWI